MAEIRIHGNADKRRAADVPEFGPDFLKCAFSTVRTIKVGSGSTARKQETRHLWLVEHRGDDTFGVRKLNTQFVPVGEESVVDRETLLAEYAPEVDIYNSRVKPAVAALDKTLDTADGHRERHEPLSAEMEYTRALDVDERNVRATFGLGLVYLERDDVGKSRVIFDELVGMDAAFENRHKHLFNEFGISLRKKRLFDEAVQYYSRALEINGDLNGEDENLYYNLARAYYENGEWKPCVEFAGRALGVDRGHEHARVLCQLAVALAEKPDLLPRYDKPSVPAETAARAAELLGADDKDRRSLAEAAETPGGDIDLSLGL
ncbi:tetratricopeptide repeat protein [Pseudodesulfovibrio sp.]|uniref:tetratricopeptide repeat protein n=1 Tax=Pseudodesulfovibrio sp. TaxID=2035812 RepID=UPI00261D30B5|nr:tetratricopeptide repeat protein [Pseudodesulfovibrio sp.]MDD3311721.1 tetratricopeptide repeat protein [Pseudodesulfovibrio sp.]